MDRGPTTARALPIYQIYLSAAVILVALWVGVTWTNRQSEMQGLAEVRRETAALALLFATHTDVTFRTVDLALIELRDQYLKDRTQIDRVISTHIRLLGNAVLQTGILRADGLVVFSTPVEARGPIYSDEREFFRVHRDSGKDALFVGRPLKGKVSGKWSIHLTRPILNKGKFEGIVVIAVDPDYFVNFYRRAGLGQSGAARMIRDTGEVMARSSGQEKYIGRVIKPTPYADPGAPLEGSFRRSAQVDGVERLSSYHRLPQYGVTVVIGPGLEERLATVRSHQRQLIWSAMALTLLALLVAFLLHRNISRNALIQAALDADHKQLEKQYQEILALQERLESQALQDPLTGLHNRRFLDAALPMEMAKARRDSYPISFIVFDLDRFKHINDTYGHAFGDHVLATVADLLKKCARESDIVCRHGGEEFVVVMPRMSAAQALQRIDACRAAVEQNLILHEDKPVRVTISAGISTFPEHGTEIDDLLRTADDAMYKSKSDGRNRVTIGAYQGSSQD